MILPVAGERDKSGGEAANDRKGELFRQDSNKQRLSK